MKKTITIIMIFFILICVFQMPALAAEIEENSIIISKMERNPQTEYSYETLKVLFPDVYFSNCNSFIYLKESPIETYETKLNDYDTLYLNVFSDGSYTWSGLFTAEETLYYDEEHKEYYTRTVKIVGYDDNNSIYGYKMHYAVNYTHNSSNNTITINDFYVTGAQYGVSVNGIHYHRSGGSQYSKPAVFTVGNYATMHGHYGLYVSDPITGDWLESGSMILMWKIRANSNGTTSESGPSLLGPYTNFYYMD